MNCLICRNEVTEGDFAYNVLEVFTTVYRKGRERQVYQTIGDWKDYRICRTCAEKRLEEIYKPSKRFFKDNFRNLVSVALGAFLVASPIVTKRTEGSAIYFIIGLASLGIAIRNMIGVNKFNKELRASFDALPEDQRLEKAAWQIIRERAPRRKGAGTISYIPKDDVTMKMSKAQISEQFNIIINVAGIIHDMFHGKTKEEIIAEDRKKRGLDAETVEDLDDRLPNTELTDED